MDKITQSQYYFVMSLYVASIIGMFTAFTLNGFVFIFALFSMFVFSNEHLKRQFKNLIYKNIIVSAFVVIPVVVAMYRLKDSFTYFYATGHIPFHYFDWLTIGAMLLLALACSFVVLVCKITLVFDLMKFSDDEKSQF